MIRLDIEGEPSEEMIKKLLQNHSTARYEKLQRYYEGKHDILDREMIDDTKPNNKLVNNFPAYISDVMQGYFMGKPVVYTSEDENYLKALQDIFDANNEQDQNSELAKAMGIKGKVYELVYADEDANVKFDMIDADNVIFIYNTDISPKPLCAIYVYKYTDIMTTKDTEKATVYTNNSIKHYKVLNNTLTLTDEEEHFFSEVPIVEYSNNDEQLGDFERELPLIDAYNKAQSDTMNDIEYFADAYLALVGMNGTDSEDIRAMKENRVILLEEQGQANWLIKDINDSALENYKNRIQQDIHRFSKTPNLTDEEFSGNLSGVALKFKLWGLEMVASTKERKFKRALQRRTRLITNYLNKKGKNYDWRNIELTFTRNIPQNVMELTQMAVQLKGIISDETLLAQLPFVEDVQAEAVRINEQYESVDLDAERIAVEGDDFNVDRQEIQPSR